MKKRVFSLLLILTLTAGLFSGAALAADAVEYADADGSVLTQEVYTLIDAGNIAENMTLSDGWYVVSETLEVSGGMTVSGDVNLILSDGCTLTVTGQDGEELGDGEAAIRVSEDNRLTIWGQAGGTGTLAAQGGKQCAGIGGSSNEDGSNITINSGVVTATGGSQGAGIGGGAGGAGMSITINGGVVTATGGNYAAGIGGGDSGDGCDITINGGTVTANGGSYAAGIGGGDESICSTNIRINGGTVTAKGGEMTNAIGGGGFYAYAEGIYVAPELPIVIGGVEVCTDRSGDTDLSCESDFLQDELTIGIEPPAAEPTPEPTEEPEPTEAPEPTEEPIPTDESEPSKVPDTGDDIGETGSVFGGRSLGILIAGIVVILGGGAVCIIVANKKKAKE